MVAALSGGSSQPHEKCDENGYSNGSDVPPAIGQDSIGDHTVHDDAGATVVQAGADTVECAGGDEAKKVATVGARPHVRGKEGRAGDAIVGYESAP